MKKKLLTILLCSMAAINLAGCGSQIYSTSSDENENTTISNSSDNKSNKEDTAKEESKVIIDDEYVTITYTGINRNGILGPEINLLVENKCDQDIIVQARGVSADGMMADNLCSIDIVKGKKAKGKLTLMKDKTDKDFKSVEGKFIIIANSFETVKEEDFLISY